MHIKHRSTITKVATCTKSIYHYISSEPWTLHNKPFPQQIYVKNSYEFIRNSDLVL